MAASFLYVTRMAAYIGPTEFGRYSLIVAVAGWLVSVGQGGGATALILLSAQHPEQSRNLLRPGVLIQIGVGFIAVTVGWLAVWRLTHDARLLAPTMLFGAASTAVLVLSVPISIHRGLNRMQWAWAPTLAQILTVALFPLVVWSRGGLSAAIACNTVACAAVCLITIPFSSKLLPNASGAKLSSLPRALIGSSLALWLVTALQWIHWKVGLLVVQTLAGSHDVGIYSAGLRIVESMRVFPWFILMTVLPSIARYAHVDPPRAMLMVRQGLRLLMLAAFPITAVVALLSWRVVGGIYTHEFEPAADVLRLAALGFIPGCAHWVFLNALVAFRAHSALIKAYSASILMQAIISALLVQHWGARGAAVGSALGETLAAFICGYFLARLAGKPIDAVTPRLMLLGACMVAYVLTKPRLNVPAALLWSGAVCAVYLAAAFFIRAISVSETLALLRRCLWLGRRPQPALQSAPLLPQDT
jgi:PST family polysaccharide transporter